MFPAQPSVSCRLYSIQMATKRQVSMISPIFTIEWVFFGGGGFPQPRVPIPARALISSANLSRAHAGHYCTRVRRYGLVG